MGAEKCKITWKRPWRPHDMFFISQERRNISRDKNLHRRPCGVVGRASFLTTRTDYRWWFDSPLVRR